MAALTAIDRIGTTIGGRYELRRLIGEGGFSTVFAAVHTVTGREVAVKLLHAHLTATEQVAQRFLMEARAMARIQHEGIVQVLDAGTDPDGRVYIALELLEGESLERALLRERTLPWQTVVAHCIDVLEALAEAHRHQIIHRDIKPGNIFISTKPGGATRARLLDFGIAHVTETKGKLTAEGLILGTPEYMSPEQGRTSNVGPASDLWSVGIVMWECLTGQTPYTGANSTDILVKIATSDAPPIQSELPDLPTAVATVIDKSLARDLAHRYRSADEMREALIRATRRASEPSIKAAPRQTAKTPQRMHPGDERWMPAPTDVVNIDIMTALSSTEPGRAGPTVLSGDAGARVSRPATLPPVSGRSSRADRDDQADRSSRPSAPPSLSSQPSPTSPSRPPSLGRPTRGASVSGSQARSAITIAEDTSEASRERVSALVALRDPSPPKSATPAALTEEPRTEATSDAPLPPLNLPDLSQEEREARTFSGNRATFRTPPTAAAKVPSRAAIGALAAVTAISAALAFVLLRDDAPPPPPRHDPQPAPTDEATPDARGPRHDRPARFALSTIDEAQLPVGAAGTAAAEEFVRHAAASNHAGGTQRMLASCVPGPGGATVYVRTMTPGALRASDRGLVACASNDLGVVTDVTSDGTDDLVAVSASAGQLVVLDATSLRPVRSIDVPGLRAIAAGTHVRFRGEPAVVAFSEPEGPSAPSVLQAIGAGSGHVLWQVRGEGSAARIGDPATLGLAAGPDADGDGVGDVAAGVGEIDDAGVAPPTDRRCVQMFSGADGHAIWSRAFCHPCPRGAQSLWLGPDVNGDTRADVAVACADAPVTLLSGADGSKLREVEAPPQREGFGRSVALVGDIDGDRAADLVVGSIGALLVFDAATGTLHGALERTGELRAFPVPPLVEGATWAIAVASSTEGFRVYTRRESDEPRGP